MQVAPPVPLAAAWGAQPRASVSAAATGTGAGQAQAPVLPITHPRAGQTLPGWVSVRVRPRTCRRCHRGEEHIGVRRAGQREGAAAPAREAEPRSSQGSLHAQLLVKTYQDKN